MWYKFCPKNAKNGIFKCGGGGDGHVARLTIKMTFKENVMMMMMMLKVMIVLIVSCSTTAFATCSRDSSVKPAIVASLSHQGFRPWKQYRDNIEQHILSVIALIFTLTEQGLLSLFIDPRVSILPILPNIGKVVSVML